MTADRMSQVEMADVLRDTVAMVAANMVRNDDLDAKTLALETIVLRPGESVSHWLDRVASLVVLLGTCSSAFLRQWADSAGVEPDRLLRIWAAAVNTRPGMTGE